MGTPCTLAHYEQTVRKRVPTALPGASMQLANAGWFTASGNHCVSRHSPALLLYTAPLDRACP